NTLRYGLKLWQDFHQEKISRETYDKRGKKVEVLLDHHLRKRKFTDEDNRRLLKGIRAQHEQGRVFLFLEHPEVEPTNNRSEQGLRSAVIARKVSQCSKNHTGTTIYEAMKSVTATLVQRGRQVAIELAA